MNLRDLDYILAVAETGHFGAAAKRCHVSQPTLSMQVRKLEEELGVVLFERGPRGATPTPGGRDVLAQARQVVDAMARLKEVARARIDPLAGTVRLGVIPTSGPYLLPLLLPALRARFPALRLHLREAMTASLLEALRRAELDAAVLSPPFESQGLVVEPLAEEAFLVALPPDHPLASATVLEPAALRGETVLGLEDGHCLRAQSARVWEQIGLDPGHEIEAASLESLRQMVSAGLGCAVIPAFAGRGPFAQGAPIALRPLRGLRPSRTLALTWRRSDPRAAALLRLAVALRAAIPATDGEAG